MLTTQYHVIKDPVHGSMQFTTLQDRWIKPVLNHPLCQRLRHIKQLGFGDTIFPGAVHTRFNHSVGCCYVAGQVAHKLALSEQDQQTVMLAALLHDIGHGPFSHAFEDLFKNKSIRHEDWTPFFLSAFQHPDFVGSYNQLNPDFPLTDAVFLQLQNIIMHKPTDQPLLADIVSSQLDADRLDYLLRDSHFCGVTYGEYDFRWLLHCLMIIDVEGKQRLGVTYKGVGAVEHYLNARRLMMRNIYFHPKKLAFEFLLVAFLKLLAQDLETTFPDIAKTPLGQFLKHVNDFNQATKPTAKQSFLENNFALYNRLTDYDVFTTLRKVAESNQAHDCVEVAKRLYYRRMPKVYPLNQAQYDQAKEIIANLPYPDWQLSLLYLPQQSYQRDTDPILVQFPNGVKALNDVSLMVDALTDKLESHYYLSMDASLLENPALQSIFQLIKQGG